MPQKAHQINEELNAFNPVSLVLVPQNLGCNQTCQLIKPVNVVSYVT